jgi:AcrR family transcriptional regulator
LIEITPYEDGNAFKADVSARTPPFVDQALTWGYAAEMVTEGAYVGDQDKPPARDRRLRADQRREMLLDAADTVIRRVGPRVSVTLIAQEAGVTKPIIYRHFGDIQDLYRALAARHEARLARWLFAAREREENPNRQARFRSVVEAFFTAVDREPNLYRFLVHTGADVSDQGGALSWFTRVWAVSIARHLAAITGEPEGSIRARATGFAMAGALQTSASWWLEERASPLTEIVDAVTDFLLAGLPRPTVEPSELGLSGTNA